MSPTVINFFTFFPASNLDIIIFPLFFNFNEVKSLFVHIECLLEYKVTIIHFFFQKKKKRIKIKTYHYITCSDRHDLFHDHTKCAFYFFDQPYCRVRWINISISLLAYSFFLLSPHILFILSDFSVFFSFVFLPQDHFMNFMAKYLPVMGVCSVDVYYS